MVGSKESCRISGCRLDVLDINAHGVFHARIWFARMGKRIGGHPVGDCNWALNLIMALLIIDHKLLRFSKKHLKGRCVFRLNIGSAKLCLRRIFFVCSQYKLRGEFDPRQIADDIFRHVGGIGSACIAGQFIYRCISMDNIDRVPDIAAKDVVQFAIEGIQMRVNQLLIHINTLKKIERVLRLAIIGKQSVIKPRHLRHINTNGIGIHFTDLTKPAQIVRFFNAKFTRPEPGFCRADINALDEKGRKSSVLRTNKKALSLYA
ncbi:hypothetical protein SDC9_113695 [bioreactor metagenome]|uniref:Uncharacterized protein n=1 Tax=bioreactor metagenome TaxID=1076179 RepID=A0A645BYK0_9ZZZZ